MALSVPNASINKQIKAADPRHFKTEITVTVLWESNNCTSELDEKQKEKQRNFQMTEFI